jgi:uncharacterized protein YndB with AHSA1/START domain
VRVRRSRVLAAGPEEVWRTVGDPDHQPRWWPRVARVEGADEQGFTQVLRSRQGRGIRADFRILERDAPHRLAWEQELEGSPFERILHRARTSVVLEAEGAGTRVTLEADQELRGWSRMAPWMVRGGTRRILDEALDGLEAVHG